MTIKGYRLADVRKAAYAFLAAIVPPLYLALQADSPGGGSVTLSEWLWIAGSALGLGAGVFGIKNAEKPVPPAAPPATIDNGGKK